MTKYLIVTMPNLSRWRIPAEFIAKHRAAYYAKFHEEENMAYQELYDAEFDVAMTDDYEIKDWATNNMNWSDVMPLAERIDDVKFDYNKAWRTDAPMEVVEQ